MLPEILASHLRILFVGPFVPQVCDDLGFYHVAPRDKFWEMLQYAGITPAMIISEPDRRALVSAKEAYLLDERYRQFFFEKKESQVLTSRVGLTDLNRRKVVMKEDEPGADPTTEDVKAFIRSVEKYAPAIVAPVMNADQFERAFKPFYPALEPRRGRQPFAIGKSEVWFIGSTSARGKEVGAMEQVFEDLSDRLKELPA